jgi:hypothetical protein
MLILAACARPAPSAPVSPACGPQGMELYGADIQPIADSDRAAIEIRVYRSGAWTREVHEPHGLEHGCLGSAELERITRALDRATWMRVVTPGKRCDGPAPSVVYFANGTAAGELYSCESTFDAATWTALDEIEAVLAAARSKR